MKKILLTVLLPYAIATHAAPEATLTAQSALLQELQKNHGEVYNALQGKTLAEVAPGVNAYIFEKLATASDATFAAYADSFIDYLVKLGNQDNKACHSVLTASQTPTLFDLQQRLGDGSKKLDPAFTALLQDNGQWRVPENFDFNKIKEIFAQAQGDLEKDGKTNGLAYTLGGETPDTPEKLKLACQGGTKFFQSLNQPQNKDKMMALRMVLGNR